jgi:hypothetical protein
MKKSVSIALATFSVLALAACGRSVDANQSATADTVEVPAEEAMAGATAMPSETATTEAANEAADSGVDTEAGAEASTGAAVDSAT